MSTQDGRVDGRVRAIVQRWAPHGRAGLLPCLQEVQEALGYLSPEACRAVAAGLRVPEAEVYGVVSFYALLYDHPVGRTVIRVCDDVPCYLNGSAEVVQALRDYLGIGPGETTPDGAYTLEVHPCLGRCERAPFLLLNDEEVGPVRPEDIPSLLQGR